LLDGTPCYTTDDDVYDEIPIDRNDKESGLNEALKLMREGESAKLILPNHLAHGLVGDLGQIPPLAILLVDVELVELQ
jgi:FKBP-type peptidyl-prolyl cis-trans isomerase